MHKRKHIRRHSHKSPRNTYNFFRSKLFYFLGFAVIVILAVSESGIVAFISGSVLGESNTSVQRVPQATMQPYQQGQAGQSGETPHLPILSPQPLKPLQPAAGTTAAHVAPGQPVLQMPPEAVEANLKSFGILTASAASGGTTATAPVYTVSTTNGFSVYTVEGYQEKHLFGVVPVHIPVTAVVSAETGQVTEQHRSFFGQLLGILSR